MKKKITRVLLRYKNIVVKLHVRLTNTKDNKEVSFHNKYVSPMGDEYINLDINSFITVEFKDPAANSADWDPSRSILLTERNMIYMVKGLKLMTHILTEGKMFAIREKTKEVVMYSDIAKDNIVNVFNLGRSQRVSMEPAIIYDDEDLSYEGCILYINKTANGIEMTTDELMSLYYVLDKVDMFAYTQLMINYYVASEGKMDEVNQKVIRKRHPLDIPPVTEASVHSTVQKEKPSLDSTFGSLLNMKKEDENK